MQVSANSIQYNYAQLQALLGQTPSPFGAAATGTGQDVPGASADSTSLTGAAATSAQPASGATPASQFSSDMLSSLISLQQVEQSPIAQASQAVVSSLDTNGDGALSLSEFEQALSGTSAGSAGATTTATGAATASTSASTNASLAAIFNQMDSNGDGELDPSELTKAVQTALDQAQQAAGGGHRHHHHHHAQTADSSSASATTDPLTSTTTSSTSTSGTASTGAATGATTDSTGTSTTASLAAAILG